MNKQLLISLISDQTIPNVQIIKEFGNDKTDYLFLLTNEMRRKGIANWIVNATHLNVTEENFVIVEEYSVENITHKLQEINYTDVHTIVNLTGGTKIMVLSVFDFFKDKQNVDIYYVTGTGNSYLKITTGGCEERIFSRSISLDEYLKAYGFSITKSQPSGVSFEKTEKIYKHCVNGVFLQYADSIKFLGEQRGKVISEKDFGRVSEFLQAIEYTPVIQNQLSKLETKYLTGEWFEEYVGNKIKYDLGLADDQILIGTTIRKHIPKQQELNTVSALLGLEDSEIVPNNEIDVMFIKENRFYVIECKTSIIAGQRTIYLPKRNKRGETILDGNGHPSMAPIIKDINILGETIYKSDALKTKFGLFAKSYIFTLSDLKQYVERDNDKQNQMVNLLKRASLSNIKIIDRELLINSCNMRNLL